MLDTRREKSRGTVSSPCPIQVAPSSVVHFHDALRLRCAPAAMAARSGPTRPFGVGAPVGNGLGRRARFDGPVPVVEDRPAVRTAQHRRIAPSRAAVQSLRRPLSIGAVRVAMHAGGSAIQRGTDRAVTFTGKPGITIPKGADALSDPIEFPVKALAQITVSIHVRDDGGTPGSAATASSTMAGRRSSVPVPCRDWIATCSAGRVCAS